MRTGENFAWTRKSVASSDSENLIQHNLAKTIRNTMACVTAVA